MKTYIATLPNGYFGSASQSWKSLNVNRIASLLEYSTEIITINDLVTLNLNEDDTVIYTASDEENIRRYLKDVMYFINQKCRILPNYNMLLCYENKGFQELFRTELGFGDLRGNYFFDIDDAILPMPKVLKTVNGAGSDGVFLVESKKDLATVKSEHFEVSKKRKLIKLQRRLRLKRSEFSIYRYRYKGFNRFVEQNFIPNLKSDYKILVFGNRYYCLKRGIKKNDFRASGSGLHEYVKPPEEVLDFAKSVFEELDNPYASLDIAHSATGCHLIEFQGTNFGPTTLLNANYRYLVSNSGWAQEKNDKDLEENFAYALNRFIGKNKRS